MKLKHQPEDFRVEEIAEPQLGGGPFALYRLAKTSLGTPEAVDAICRAWRIAREAVAVGGLITDQIFLFDDYASVHCLAAWIAAMVGGTGLAPLAEQAGRALGRSRAGRAVLGAVADRPHRITYKRLVRG